LLRRYVVKRIWLLEIAVIAMILVIRVTLSR